MAVEQPWSKPVDDIADTLRVDPAEGLTPDEVNNRREEHGRNKLREAESRSWQNILIEQFKSLLVVLLLVAAGASLAFGETVEAGAIVLVVVINAVIGFVTELRAVRSMEALQELGQVESTVRRGGSNQTLDAEEIVPGDVVVLSPGAIITADIRLTEASKLQVDEAALTGESTPVSKTTDPIDADTELAERQNMAFKGTAVTRGEGEGIVVATGMETEIGNISSLVAEAEQEETPLQERLDTLGQRLVWVTVGIAAVIAVAGIIAGRDTLRIIETAIALAVATVPEGLPLVATVGLARGMWRMAKRNAIIERLSAVETLGATTVICTDKTGTLTENEMTVTRLAPAAAPIIEVSGTGLQMEGEFTQGDDTLSPQADDPLRRMLEVGALCNNAQVNGDATGEPMEVALLVVARKAGMSRDGLLDEQPEAREVAFERDTTMMATFHEQNGGYRVAIKGAPEAVLDAATHIYDEDGRRDITDEDRDHWEERNDTLAHEGLRILALAEGEADSTEADPYADFAFLGLVGLLDPPREDVREAIKACQDAGIQIVMVTGDHPATAERVAEAVHLTDAAEAIRGDALVDPDTASDEERQKVLATRILARVTPEQKLNLIAFHQNDNQIVAMTGDGVNDAPALKKADIGVAMGERGTQVAKDAADMILMDDAFSTIVVAVEQGRAIFENIRKFVLYLLSCNSSEIMVVAAASLLNTSSLPITPLQILFLNVVTDVFPALALGVGEGDPALMEREPRDTDEPVLLSRHWRGVAGYGLLITVAVMAVYFIALNQFNMPTEQATTLSFLTLAAAQLWHVFNMRGSDSHPIKNEVTTNRYVWGALVLCIGLLAAAVYVPFLSNLLSTVNPGLQGWLLVAGGSLFPLIVGQIALLFNVGGS